MPRGVLFLVRYGEIAVKGRGTRARMVRLLERNIAAALRERGVEGFRVWSRDARVFVEVPDGDGSRALDALSRVFGIVSYSPVARVKHGGLDDIVSRGVELFSSQVRGRSFRVRARRSGREPFTSKDVEEALGAALLEAGAGRVDLENPEVTVYVEVRGREAYFYTVVLEGPGGLPLGSEGRVLALVSGGIDSPVAAWMMMRRGAEVDMVFFNLGGEAHELGVLKVAKILADGWSHGYSPRLHMVDFRPVAAVLMEEVDEGVRGIVLRRLMFRAAEVVANEEGALGLVTGESLGQVSSQTLHNMLAAEKGIGLPIYRPLIGMDKNEIAGVARRIGTYEVSARLQEFCAIAAGKPRTRVSPEEVDEAEKRVDPALVRRLVGERRVVALSRLSPRILELELGQGCEQP